MTHDSRTEIKGFYLFIIFLLITAQKINAQKQTATVSQTWVGYFNQTRYSDKWGLWADIHLRTKEETFNNLSQGIARIGLTYYLNDNTKITGGYAFVNHFPAENHKNISQPEHRPWQQIQWHTKYSRLRLMQWMRLEERFRHKIENDDKLATGYHFNYRIRFNFFFAAPLGKKAFAPKSLSFIANDEVHVNFGKQIVYNYFDQNRFFVGLGYHTNNHDIFQFGYTNVFQQQAAGNKYKTIHALRLFYFHNLDLRKKT